MRRRGIGGHAVGIFNRCPGRILFPFRLFNCLMSSAETPLYFWEIDHRLSPLRTVWYWPEAFTALEDERARLTEPLLLTANR